MSTARSIRVDSPGIVGRVHLHHFCALCSFWRLLLLFRLESAGLSDRYIPGIHRPGTARQVYDKSPFFVETQGNALESLVPMLDRDLSTERHASLFPFLHQYFAASPDHGFIQAFDRRKDGLKELEAIDRPSAGDFQGGRCNGEFLGKRRLIDVDADAGD